MRLLGFERRWCGAVMDAVIPPGSSDVLPLGAGDTGCVQQCEDMLLRLPFAGAFGLRVSLWTVYLLPLFVLGRFKTLSGLTEQEREEYLEKIYKHRIYLVRQSLILVKSVVCLSYCGDDRVQESLGMREPSHLPHGGV